MGGKNKGRRGGGRAPAPPTMHTHQPYFAEVVSVSANGRSVAAQPHTIRTQPNPPPYVQKVFVTNAVVDSWDFSYDLGDSTLIGEVQDPEKDGIRLAKRKVYENSVSLEHNFFFFLIF